MSQAPSPIEPRLTQRSSRGQRRREGAAAPDTETVTVPNVLSRRRPPPAPRRRPPLASFALGLGLGFLLGQHHLALGPLLAAVGKLPHRVQALGLDQKPVLVLGSDVVSGNTDVIFAVQIHNGITRVIQVPRDTYVETAGQGVMKANALYGLLGPVAVKQEVSQLIGMPVQHHLKVNLDAVAKVADALGGVEVEVPKRMVYVDNSQGLYIDLDPGLQVLKGEKLEGFLRFRHDEQGDLGRMERQRLVINQVFRKLAQPATLAQLPALLKIAGEDIDTDLSPLELTQLLGAMGHTKLSTQRLNGREYWENELSYWMPATNLQHPSGNGEIPPN
jgi:LCP family protein required for cell wall assembly